VQIYTVRKINHICIIFLYFTIPNITIYIESFQYQLLEVTTCLKKG